MAELEEAGVSETAATTLSKKERKKLKTTTPPVVEKQATNSTTEPVMVKTIGAKNSKEYARMLESFWKLSEYNETTRIEGTRNIIKYFAQVKRGDEAYSYVLTRLVKGLASNRKYSRLGYSACLTELMNTSRSLTLAEILTVAKTHLSITDSAASVDKQNMLTKEELRHMHIGLLFVYLAWIQSTRFLDSDDSTIETIVNDLNRLRKDSDIKVNYFLKSFLRFLFNILDFIKLGMSLGKF